MYGPFLIPVLQRKIPTDLNIILGRYFHGKNSWDIKELLEQFKIELMAREKSVVPSDEMPESIDQFTATSLISTTNDVNKQEIRKVILCIFCNKLHKSQYCKTVTDVSSRKSILKEKGRCFSCLQSEIDRSKGVCLDHCTRQG